MEYGRYAALKERIVPGLRFNQDIYEETLARHVPARGIWLDAGCGSHVLPPWRREAERKLVAEAGLVVGCDVDRPALARHATLDRRVVSVLEALPFRTASVTLVTCNMVVEHLRRPPQVFAELARVLAPAGRVIVHTPNRLSPVVLVSRAVPRRLRARLVRALDGRDEADVFPAYYRANTPRRLERLMSRAGLVRESCRLLASDAALAALPPALVVPELFLIRLTLRPAFRRMRVSILASFVKPTREGA